MFKVINTDTEDAPDKARPTRRRRPRRNAWRDGLAAQSVIARPRGHQTPIGPSSGPSSRALNLARRSSMNSSCGLSRSSGACVAQLPSKQPFFNAMSAWTTATERTLESPKKRLPLSASRDCLIAVDTKAQSELPKPLSAHRSRYRPATDRVHRKSPNPFVAWPLSNSTHADAWALTK